MQDKPVLLMKKVINLFFRELDAMNSEKLQEPISGHNMIVIEYLMRQKNLSIKEIWRIIFWCGVPPFQRCCV